ncbi:hypothetical protein, partial [Salmonella enterica]|uniref:hypothetical protein n=1 Tax=Salmonella enterica TaxID=28901 RepID=UPI003D2C6084
MKKVLSLCIIVFFAGISSIHAQGGGQMDPAQMKEMMKNRYKDAMPYLTPVQLDSVTNIVMDSRSGMRGLRDM